MSAVASAERGESMNSNAISIPNLLFPTVGNGGNMAPQTWGDIVAPYLRDTLRTDCAFTDNEAALHSRFFDEHLRKFLGPVPMLEPVGSRNHILARPSYASAMTNDNTPFEFSYCWKSGKQDGVPIFRHIMDVVPANSPETRSESLRAAIQAIQDLQRLSRRTDNGLRLDMFAPLCEHVTTHFLELEAHFHSTSPKCCGPSSTFLGFELGRSEAKVKLYWLLPSCQTPTVMLDWLDELFSTCQPIDALFASHGFSDCWFDVRNYVATHSEVLRPRMLSIDATRFPSTRLKLYTRCLLTQEADTFQDMMTHLTLGGKLNLAVDFLNTVGRVWQSLVKQSTTKPRYVLLLHEIGISKSTGRAVLGAKLYIMCGEITAPDSVIANELMKHCSVLRDAGLMNSLASSMRSTGNIAEIGFASRGEETEVGLYFNPALFTSAKEQATTDGNFIRARCDIDGN